MPASALGSRVTGSDGVQLLPKSASTGWASMKRATAGTGAGANADDVSQVSLASLSHVTASPPWPASMIALRALSRERHHMRAALARASRSAKRLNLQSVTAVVILPGPS